MIPKRVAGTVHNFCPMKNQKRRVEWSWYHAVKQRYNITRVFSGIGHTGRCLGCHQQEEQERNAFASDLFFKSLFLLCCITILLKKKALHQTLKETHPRKWKDTLVGTDSHIIFILYDFVPHATCVAITCTTNHTHGLTFLLIGSNE